MTSSTPVTRVKGMYDLTPAQTARWQWVEDTAQSVLQAYGYDEIRLPVLEKAQLFSGAMGETTDVVSKEMYAFTDRGGDVLALRPEGTAGCVRAALQNGMLGAHSVKLRYSGPMFRRENVQRGRNRQFYQIGAEAFGLPGPDVDAEQIIMLADLWRRLGLKDLRLELNTLGTPASRQVYRDTLVEYFTAHRDQLDEDSLRRLEVNPLRILDSKNPQLAPLIAGAPTLTDSVDAESAAHFAQIQRWLDEAGIDYVLNPRLVRGLDYYTRTVFEWITDELGAQGTVCAGGRYDGLVEAQGGRSTPAVGFAMGVDRLVELTEVQGLESPGEGRSIYLVTAGQAQDRAVVIASWLREVLPGWRVLCNLGGGSMKAQFKRADRSGAHFAAVVGEDELARGCVTLKPLRSEADQRTVSIEDLGRELQ